jgi:hypothetical protein
MTKIAWKKGDLFKQEMSGHAQELYGIVCMVDQDAKVHTVVIAFQFAQHHTSALSPFVAVRMEMPQHCVPSSPEELPAAVRPQLLSILAAIV